MRYLLHSILLVFAVLQASAGQDTAIFEDFDIADPVANEQPVCLEEDCAGRDFSSEEQTEIRPFEPGFTITIYANAPRYTFPSVAKLIHGVFPPVISNLNWEGMGGCTSTLIDPEIILTAQHCVLNDQGRAIPSFSVRFRETKNVGVHTQTIKVSKSNLVLAANGHRLDSKGNITWNRERDLALLKLDEPVPDWPTRVAKLATLPDLTHHTILNFVGFGMQLANTQGQSGRKRKLGFISQDVANLSVTNGSYETRSFRVRGRFLLEGRVVSAAICNGDSGGPVFLANDVNSEDMVLIGVNHAVTFGNSPEQCSRPDSESFLVGTLANMDFINAGLEKLKSN